MFEEYKYLRIQGRNLSANTLTGKGIFSLCMEMVRNKIMDDEDSQLYLAINDWFSENLPWPEPCMKQDPVICYFKVENSEEMLKWMKPAMWLLDRYNQPYYLVLTNNPGEIVYEDKYQIVARVDDITISPITAPWGPEDD